MKLEPVACPFCGNYPWFDGDADHFDADHYYVDMNLTCCVTMNERMGWREANCTPVKDRQERLKAALVEKWNKRAIPDGYVVVRAEPTKAMIDAGWDAFALPGGEVIAVYKAMIAAKAES